jgi:SAM-dependent methyltransferase
MRENEIYAQPRVITDLEDCFFYHTMEIPGYGHVEGVADLRGRERKYLGGVDFEGKRVLEIGTASGFLSFYMEKQGAEVVSYDLSERDAWDVVPFSQFDHKSLMKRVSAGIRKLNNSYWLCHRAFNSKARMVYGSVYNIPEEIGEFDYTIFCATLVHFQNPFLALQNALKLTKEKVIVTDLLGYRHILSYILNWFLKPRTVFLPDYRRAQSWDVETALENRPACLSWWLLDPHIIKHFLGVLGFESTTVTFHVERLKDFRRGKSLTYTVVGQRTKGLK